MPQLGEILSQILNGIAEARRAADLESVRTAQLYAQEPLLQGLAIPRLRLPEIVIDLPVAIEGHTAAQEAVEAAPADVVHAVQKSLQQAVDDGLLDATRSKQLGEALTQGLHERIAGIKRRKPASLGEALAGELSQRLARAVKQTKVDLHKGEHAQLNERLRQAGLQAALVKPAIPAALKVAAETAQVKNLCTNSTVTHIKIVVREEGMEWTTLTNDDGTSRARLTPE